MSRQIVMGSRSVPRKPTKGRLERRSLSKQYEGGKGGCLGKLRRAVVMSPDNHQKADFGGGFFQTSQGAVTKSGSQVSGIKGPGGASYY